MVFQEILFGFFINISKYNNEQTIPYEALPQDREAYSKEYAHRLCALLRGASAQILQSSACTQHAPTDSRPSTSEAAIHILSGAACCHWGGALLCPARACAAPIAALSCSMPPSASAAACEAKEGSFGPAPALCPSCTVPRSLHRHNRSASARDMHAATCGEAWLPYCTHTRLLYSHRVSVAPASRPASRQSRPAERLVHVHMQCMCISNACASTRPHPSLGA